MKEEKPYVLYLTCNDCAFVDMVFSDKAKNWKCPLCEIRKGKMKEQEPLKFKPKIKGYRIDKDGTVHPDRRTGEYNWYRKSQAKVIVDPNLKNA